MGQVRITKKGLQLMILILCVVSLGIGFGLWYITGAPNLSPTDSDAAQGCGQNDDRRSCESSCSGEKGPPGHKVNYECRWVDGGCRDGNNLCEGSGDGGGGHVCDNIPPSKDNPKKCEIGATVCQTDSNGKNTGYLCTCTDFSVHSCWTDWRCTEFNTSRCPTTEPSPIKGSCKLVGGCIDNGTTGTNGATFHIHKCPGMSYEEGSSNGCNTSNPTLSSSARICPGVPSGFCGWVQIDQDGYSTGESGCFRSWYYPCDGNPPDEPPDEPPPPPPTTNVCEGGGVTSPTNRVTTTIGESVNFCGYAYDADGIDVDNIQITLDGTVVGNATVTDACADPNDPICLQYAGKNPVKWCYTFVSTTEGDSVIQAVWKDTKGVTGNSCQGEREITTAVVQDDWIADKSAARICINENTPNVAVRLNYTITITNSADATKQINTIVDTLDSKVQSSYIELESIVPNASVSGNVITWDLTGAAGVFAPGETKSFRYSLVIPKGAFGTYHNVAVISPMDAESDIEVDETIIASCDVPDTALFDSVGSKIAVGVFLILVALVYAYIDPLGTRTGSVAYRFSKDGRLQKSRESFEKRVVR